MGQLTTIALRKETYLRLSQLGKTPDSFNDIIERLLDEHNGDRELQKKIFETFSPEHVAERTQPT